MKYHHFDALDSTNDHLIKMAESGAPEWTVVIADRQTLGRGRRSRDWWSPDGNLHMSILLRPTVSPQELLRLPLTASLAVLSALGSAGSSLTVKWPNDVLLDGRKMAGILTESRSEGNRVHWAVVGIGVNMVSTKDDIPARLRERMAFVHELDLILEPNELAVRIARSMKKWSGSMKGKDWERAMEEWSRRADWNTPYTYRNGIRHIVGVTVRLDDSGGLVMETEDGEMVVYSGEIEELGES